MGLICEGSMFISDLMIWILRLREIISHSLWPREEIVSLASQWRKKPAE